MADGKFYWLKLKRDFFRRHDIKIIEAMPNGKDYVLFYLKLLCESIDHEGKLRFSDSIPYSADMLAIITDTNVDIVKAATKLFIELGMMELMDDGTFYMAEVTKMIGSAANNDNANRQRRFRERQKAMLLEDSVTKNNDCVTNNNESKSKRKSKSKKDNNTYEQEFNSLWKEYPRKIGKQNAFKAYCKAREDGESFEQVEQGLNAYKAYIVANKTDERYIKHGSTWFNQRSWNDDYTVEIRSGECMERGEDLDAILLEQIKRRA